MNPNPLTCAVRTGIMAMAAPAARPTIEPLMQLQPLADASQYELIVYGDIGESWWGESVTARSVVEQLNALGAEVQQINVRINSYGGSVSDGLAIYNALRRASARKAVTIDGVAMSSASLIAMAGDEVVMGDASLLMIHAPWGGAVGNAKEMRNFADVLDTFADAMAGAYVTKSGKPRSDVLALLTDGVDHYYTADQAVAEGFADRMVTEQPDTSSDEQARAFASGLLQRFLTRAPEDVAKLAIAAARRPPLEASNPAASHPPATPEPEGDDLVTYLARARQRLMNRATDANGGGGGNSNPAPAPAPAPAADPHAQALAAVRDRNDRIHAALRDVMDAPGIRDLYAEALRDPTMAVESVQTKALAILGAQASPAAGGAPRIEGGTDERDRMIDGVSNAILARAGLAKPEAGNQYNGIKLQQIVRMSLQRAGATGLDRMSGSQLFDRVVALHGSSDFPLLVANTANKALRAAYDMAPQTWRSWCAVGEVSDFKANSRIQLGTFNSLAEIKPGGEYTYGSISEEAETITAITKGKGLALTRQLVINDDLGAFVGAARALGFAAQRTVNEDAYARLYAATVMSDGGALFNTTAVTSAGGHANLAGAGGAISATTLGAGRAAMALQKDKNLRTPLNLRPRWLLVPESRLQVAYDVLKPFVAATGGSNFVVDLGLTIVSDANMDANSTTAWHLVADQNIAPLIEVDFLDGNEVPYVAEQVDWETDAMKFKVRLDYGVQAIDWRAGYKNPGA